MSEEEKKELEYLRFFYSECDFGPAHGDVIDAINKVFVSHTGLEVPEGYQHHKGGKV